ncbi:uncharacterized protein LOC143446594 isoform X2 [Clavelina lepadiformis]|uniref:uncharacterized protein LOC143446594 isoform X2 n=1 Tax=Clavelina lepadiformis TaxID=159417 RepID=UPI004042D5D1
MKKICYPDKTFGIMAEAETVEGKVTLDANALIEEAVSAMDKEKTSEEGAVADDADTTDIVSKAFTSVEGGDGSEVQYVTMTPEEAAAAGVEEEEQVVTTSLQFDPANPSVLYTADGTLINQSDLSPEEQALVQAALQQHLAEQEAEQQLAMIEQNGTATDSGQFTSQAVTASETTLIQQSTAGGQPLDGNVVMMDTSASSAVDPVAVITPATATAVSTLASSVNLASPNTNASQIVQTLADNVRRQQEYIKAQNLLNRVKMSSKSELPEGFRYEEKIVIRNGQPQVVKMPVKNTAPAPKRPEIPAALANLMPKIEVGKDGSQVIRIHQSQISADQLKSLQENPNVRLVFRPASSSRARTAATATAAVHGMQGRKRGRPRKSFDDNATARPAAVVQAADDSPPAKTRYGRTTKMPYYQKDYLSPGPENGEEDNGRSEKILPRPPPVPQYFPARRGRPPGSTNKNVLDKAYRRSASYARKIEQLREQEFFEDEELANARLSIVPQKPALTSVEQAISTRRKNRLRELLSACSEEEIMEVALPHLARVFSLWEFLVMKVEKNKMSRVYFADVYKEYEVLHRYVSRLTEKYKQVLSHEKESQVEKNEGKEEELENEKKNFIKIRCKKLAESLGLDQDELEDAFINLIDSEETAAAKAQAATDTQTTSAVLKSNGIQEATETSETVTDGRTSDVKQTTGDPEEASLPAIEASKTTETTKEDGTEAMDVDQTTTQQQSATDEIPVADGQSSEEGKSQAVAEATTATVAAEEGEADNGGTQIIQIGTGDDKQFIEVPEGYTLIQTPEGLVMSQPGTTLSQAEDGTIYVTQEDGSTAPLDAQKGVPLETVESLLSLEGQQ